MDIGIIPKHIDTTYTRKLRRKRCKNKVNGAKQYKNRSNPEGLLLM